MATTDASRRLEQLVGELDQLPGAARDVALDCLRSVLALHAEGLTRVLQLVDNAGEAGQALHRVLADDKLVRALLLVHGLHPDSLETRLHQALEKVRPYMQSHGGNVEVIALDQEVARLRFHGTCQTCPSSAVTMELAIRRAVEEACPDLLGLELESSPAAGPAAETAVGGGEPLTCIDAVVS